MQTSQKPIAIVSGASRGIGRATALMLNQQGYTVIGLYQNSDQHAASVAEHGVAMRKVNVGIEADVTQLVQHVTEEYGRIDVVINNAGIDIFGPIETYSVQDWNTMLATNITGAFLLSRFTIEHLKQSPNPVIINVSSRLGIPDFAEPEFVVYGTAKAALNFFTIALAKELADTRIRVNAVIPTPTKTDLFKEVFTPAEEQALEAAGKLGTPEEVAELVWKLIANKSQSGELVFDPRVSHA